MPGTQDWLNAQYASYGYGYSAPAAAAGGPSHTSFVLWVALLGVVLPVVILGGLQVGGFRFVYHSGKLF